MKILTLFMLFVAGTSISIFAQNKEIDKEACDKWVHLEEVDGKTCLVSGDGKKVFYKLYSKEMGAVSVIKELKSKEVIKEFNNTNFECSFNRDRYFCFRLATDSLVIYDTKTNSTTYLAKVYSHFIIRSLTEDILGFYTYEDSVSILNLYSTNKGNLKVIKNVERHWISDNGQNLLIKSKNRLFHLDLTSLMLSEVSDSYNVEVADFDDTNSSVAFITQWGNGYVIKMCNLLSGRTNILMDDSSTFLGNEKVIDPSFIDFPSNNVIFKISQKKRKEINEKSIVSRGVDVWSYKDIELQDRQIYNISTLGSAKYTCMINTKTNVATQIETDNLVLEPNQKFKNYLILTTPVNVNEFYWNGQRRKLYLFSIKSGENIFITESGYPSFTNASLSPEERYLVWFDCRESNYYSYEVDTKVLRRISNYVDGSLSERNQRGGAAKVINRSSPFGNYYWVESDQSIIVNAKNDIIQLDVTGKRPPINLTNGYGDRMNIKFRLLDDAGAPYRTGNNKYLVWAFNQDNKQNGFWNISFGVQKDPTEIIMSDNVYYFSYMAPIVTYNSAENAMRFKPVKSYKSNIYILRKMSSREPPNLYYTNDFKNLIQVTDIHPDKAYTWPNARLLTYTLPDGQRAEGILHFPDNLDSTKMYPVILNYYERRSECLNVFRTPALSSSNINIPWYVSRGYIVFEPDYYYVRGKTAKSVVECTKAALTELYKSSYINRSKIGIQGQSHGGYETNILATGTNLFAAACEMAGYTNVISEYGSLRPGGYNNQVAADLDQRNLGVYPWEHPEVFLENSPIFHISNMTTPLLMIHNKADDAVLFSQALELFLAMRRMGKKVWLLQYDREGHSIVKEENKLDFTIRMQQFFDHFLKDAPIPNWMSKGVPAVLKGISSGLEYDMGDSN